MPGCDRSGAVNGVQPSVGSRNASSSALSLPLLIVVDPASAAWLAALNWAVRPLAVSRYCVVTLSLWSWSIMLKFRVVGQATPAAFMAVPVAGTARVPAASARCAAWKNWVPLQNDTWPKMDPRSPFTQRPWNSAVRVAPTWVRLVPLKPKSMVTTAPAGSVGTTGVAAGWVPWVMTSGSYTDSLPVAGSRIVAWTNAPRLPKLAMVQPDACGVIPFGPVSWYGVARPCADSGFAGTTMSQDTLAAAAAAGAVAVGAAVAAAVPVAVGQMVGVADAVAPAVGAVGPPWSPRQSRSPRPWPGRSRPARPRSRSAWAPRSRRWWPARLWQPRWSLPLCWPPTAWRRLRPRWQRY